MRRFLIRLVINALGLWAAAWLVGGIQLTGGVVGVLVVALVFGIVNAFLKPFIFLMSLPFILLSFGLFTFVVNGIILWITAAFTSALSVSGLWAATLGSIVISLVNIVLSEWKEDRRRSD